MNHHAQDGAERGRLMPGDSNLGPYTIDFRLLAQQAAIGIVQVSLEARILGANDALCAILGYAPEEMRGKSLAEILHPDHLAQSLEKHQQLIGGTLAHYSLETQ